MLTVSHVTRGFHGKAALSDVSVTFAPGHIYALIGPNGAGKTTLINIVNNVLLPDSGTVEIDGKPLDLRGTVSSRIFTVLSGDRGLHWRLTARENIRYFLSLKGISRGEADRRIAASMESDDMGLKPLLDERIEELSYGQKKKVALLIGAVSDARYLIIDEITEGLDVDTRNELVTILKGIISHDKCIITATHDLPFAAQACDQAVFLFDGTIRHVMAVERGEDLFAVYQSIKGEQP